AVQALSGTDAPGGGVRPAARFADLLALWDRARLAWRDRDGDAAVTALTPMRALLVLESEQDYRRFGIAYDGTSARARVRGGRTQAEETIGGAVFARDPAAD